MSNAKILVVDDEPSIIDLTTAYLQNEGYEVYSTCAATPAPQAARCGGAGVAALIGFLPPSSTRQNWRISAGPVSALQPIAVPPKRPEYGEPDPTGVALACDITT